MAYGVLRNLCASALLALAIAGPAAAADSRPDSRLADAAQERDSTAINAILSARGANPNGVQVDGTTALHWASHFNDRALVERLIKAGADVNAANRYGVTPLMLASEHGQGSGVVEKLLAAGARPDTATQEGETALLLASRAGDTASVRLLLAKGAAVYAAEGWRRQTPLMWAAAENNRETAIALINAGADIRAKSQAGFTPLLFAVRAGHLDMVRLLLDKGANVDDAMGDGTSALSMAALNAHWELGVYLLDRGANPNAAGQGWTPLHQTAITRSPHHQNVNPQRIPTGKLDSMDFIRALIAHGADVNQRTTQSRLDSFRNHVDRDGATAFWLAAKAADVPMMRVLVASGADPLISTNKHITPLAAAAGIGYGQGQSPGTDIEAVEAVRYAFELGGDVNAIDDDGWTAMHGAAGRGSNAIVQFLYDKGAKIDVATKAEGWTPWKVADGVYLAGTFKRQLHTADYIRQIMDREASRNQTAQLADPSKRTP